MPDQMTLTAPATSSIGTFGSTRSRIVSRWESLLKTYRRHWLTITALVVGTAPFAAFDRASTPHSRKYDIP